MINVAVTTRNIQIQGVLAIRNEINGIVILMHELSTRLIICLNWAYYIHHFDFFCKCHICFLEQKTPNKMTLFLKRKLCRVSYFIIFFEFKFVFFLISFFNFFKNGLSFWRMNLKKVSQADGEYKSNVIKILFNAIGSVFLVCIECF